MAVLVETAQPNDGIRHVEQETTLYLGVTGCLGQGTLYVTESFVRWVCADDKGLTLPYPNIILHAISRDHGKFPHDCIYIHTDAELNGLPPVGNGHSTGEEGSDDGLTLDECPPVSEIFFVPQNSSSLTSIFDSMAACQTLHPDPHDLSSDEDFFEEEDEDLEDANAQLQDMDLAGKETNGDHDYEMDTERFEDAEEDLPGPPN